MDRLKQAEKYFKGELTKGEAREFMEWITSTSAEEDLSARIDALWSGTTKHQQESEWNQTALLQRINQEKENTVPLGQMTIIGRTPKRKLSVRNIKFLAAAAITTLLTSLFLIMSPDRTGRSKEQIEVVQVIKENPAGQKSKLHLPDGTVVYLNAESRITYQSTFSQRREVTLTGEAYFEVIKDAARPFVVKSGRLSTTALGTAFNIQAFPGTERIRVTLMSGRVRVDDATTRQSVELSPLEEVSVDDKTRALEKTTLATDDGVLWKEGIMKFSKTPFEEVVMELERWYGVTFKIDGKPKDVLCSGEFKNEYLSNVLNVLSHNIGFQYSINDKYVTLTFNQ